MNVRYLLTALGLLCATLALAGEPENPTAGRVVFGTCSACHLPAGEGVPGVFPPLKNRMVKIASTRPGREYLIHVLLKGIHGRITVDGVLYQGYMQGYQDTFRDDQISAVLNYVATELSDPVPPDFALFSATEVTQVRLKFASGTTTSLEKRNQLGLD